jgi:hypothetical protein
MGTMVGDDGAGNQIGVAPAAKWIEANGCDSCSDEDLIESGEWLLAPTDLSGNNPRPDLRPNIINNSWGSVIPSNDPFMEEVILAWEAAGIFGQWSNGNSGPACATSGSPGSRIATYSAGAYDINNNIADFSGRGPGQDGEIKPNIAAPGVNVRSSLPGSSYGNFNGTSMASPHVAGTIALMLSAAPALIGDITETRQILDDTATDVDDTSCGGTADDNNVFGEGRLDALAAVTESPRGPTGTLTGTVTDAGTGAPIAGATVSVTIEGRTRTATTDADGVYTFSTLPVGTYDFTASAFGYGSATATATITESATTILDFALSPVPSHSVSGTVTDDQGNPVAGATVTIEGTPIPPTTTDADGHYEFASVPEGTYTLTVDAGGCFAAASVPLLVGATDVVLDVTLDRRSDAYGHTCAVEPSDYIEATDATGLTGDDAAVTLDLPFEFPFYGSFHSSINVATNGYLSFGEPSAVFANSAIPSTAMPNNAIYPFWDDLIIDGEADVLTSDLGDRFVVEWRNVRPFDSTAPIPRWDFEAVLYQGTGEILFQYRSLETPKEQGSSATVGIENADGTDALQYSFNQPVLSDANAIRFSPPPSGSLSGTVTDANDGLPIAGVTVTATGDNGVVRSTTTDADGNYRVVLPAGTYDVTFTKTNYVTETVEDVVIEVAEEATLDAVLRTGVADVEPDAIDDVLLAGWVRDYIVTLTNSGSADLTWEAREIGGGRVDTAAVMGANAAMRNPSADPNARTSRGAFLGAAPRGAAPQAPGDVITSWPAGLDLPWGVGYTGNVWISDPIAITNTEFTTDGTPTGVEYPASWAGVWAGDMAYDAARGTLCQVNVGGDNGIYCWDPATGDVADSLTGSPWATISQRGLAYNPDDDTFYIGGWNEGIIYHVAGLSHPTPGETLDQCAPDDPSISGLAYNNSAGVLWMVTNSDSDTIYEIDPADCSTIATVAFPNSAGFSGAGVEMAEDGNLWVTNQTDGNAYLIDSGVPAFSDVPWLDVDPDSGALAPGESEDLTITVDTTGLEPGEYTASVVLVTNAGRQPRVTIPIHILVTGYLVNVNAGGPEIPADSGGEPWAADQPFDGSWGWEYDSRERNTSADIGGTEDDEIYQDARTGKFFNYRFDELPDGVYEVVLHFAEIQGKRPGQRRFDVSADGAPLLLAYDIAEDVGQNYASVRTFYVEVHDGRLRIQFNERFRYGQPIVNGLQLTHRPDLTD